MLESSCNREACSLHSTAILCPSSSGTASVDGASFFILEQISEECVLLWAHSFCDHRRASSSIFAREPQSLQSADTFDHEGGKSTFKGYRLCFKRLLVPPFTAVTVIPAVSERDVAVSSLTVEAIARSHRAQSSGATFLYFDVVKAVSLMDLRVLRLHHRMGPPPIASSTLSTISELAIIASAVPSAEASARSSNTLLSASASSGSISARLLESLSGVAFLVTAAPAVALPAITAVAHHTPHC